MRSDHPGDGLLVSGVVAPDRADAVFTVVSTVTGRRVTPGTVPLPGSTPTAGTGCGAPEAGLPAMVQTAPPAWWDDAVGDGLVASGQPSAGSGSPCPCSPRPRASCSIWCRRR